MRKRPSIISRACNRLEREASGRAVAAVRPVSLQVWLFQLNSEDAVVGVRLDPVPSRRGLGIWAEQVVDCGKAADDPLPEMGVVERMTDKGETRLGGVERDVRKIGVRPPDDGVGVEAESVFERLSQGVEPAVDDPERRPPLDPTARVLVAMPVLRPPTRCLVADVHKTHAGQGGR